MKLQYFVGRASRPSRFSNRGIEQKHVLIFPAVSPAPTGGVGGLLPDESASVQGLNARIVLGILWLALVGLPFATNAQSYSIDWSKIAGGGGMSTGGTYQVSGTIGQPDATTQTLTGGNYSLTGGFWSLISVVQTAGAPTLYIGHSGNGIIISWASSATGFALQQSSNLGANHWTASVYTISTNGATESITVTPPTGNLFFRLKSQ
jgi:hypothetical protein